MTVGDPELRSYVAFQDDASLLASAFTRNTKHATRNSKSVIPYMSLSEEDTESPTAMYSLNGCWRS